MRTMNEQPDAGTRTIVITGITRGLGLALAERLLGQGHTVLGCGTTSTGVLALQNAQPAPHDVAVVDVTDTVAVEAWARRLVAGFGAPDLLINNAGVINDPAPLWEIGPDAFGRLMDVNVDGTVNVIRAFAPAMIQAGRGVIANLSSGWGRSTSPQVAPYCASKWAIEGLTRALAQELPRPLAAVAVSPGAVATDMLRRVWGEEADASLDAAAWAQGAAPFFLGLGPQDNGRSVTTPRG
jgi:NAD(P)-dependent dehydrogenase (short-subunit alcohol dehydrogenase family)